MKKLVNIIEKSSMLEFSIQEGDTKIKMSRRGDRRRAGRAAHGCEDRGAGGGYGG